ncbi:MAG: M1 family metallopeptidase [Bacteroidota bacterium]
MKHLFFLSTFIFLNFSYSQTYWQQEVNYKIDVKLNDVEHTISAFETFEYINHSPNSLDFIYVHLWANAYRNGETALGKQLYAGKETMLRFGEEKDKGGIDSLDFKVNGEKVKWEYDPKHIDICKIYLNKALQSGERMTVSTPFKVKLPSGKISRLGHIGQSYQITQWYPKPAVYDKNGWNQMPYLNQGEFYSEYGSYDVSITLPKNYVVGATGDLQTESEIDFLNEKVKTTENYLKTNSLPSDFMLTTEDTIKNSKKNPGYKPSFPASSTDWKTIRYTQSKVHDFAWFADKRYHVLKGEVTLPHSKRKVTSWSMFTAANHKVWANSIEYINDAVSYYSKWNGDYPYNQVTAVDGTISAGGGMEYPNVTVIGNTDSAMGLEVVIVHEVGHNWFYGILGSNERIHGWMDEGLNTLNEVRYVQTKYPNNTEMSNMVLNGRFHLNDLDHQDMGDISYRMMAILGEDQPIETASVDFTSGNYGFIMYQKTGLVFHYLKEYLGEKVFDTAMQSYFETWKFKHPQPEDLRSVFEGRTSKRLNWLFEDLIQTTNYIDYKIKNVKVKDGKTTVKVKNKGHVNGPIPVTLSFENKMETKWTSSEFYKKSSVLVFETQKPDSAVIDLNKQIPELFRTNNSWNKSWLFNKKEPLKYEFFLGDNERNKSNNFWLPLVAGNQTDKFMLGLGLHNMGIPFKRFQYLIAPMYSFGRNNVAGIGEFSYTFLPKSGIKLTRIGASVKSFSYENNKSYYVGISPYVYFKIGNRGKASPISESILLQGIYKYDENYFNGPELLVLPGIKRTTYSDFAGIFFRYNFMFKKPDFQIDATLRTDYYDNLNSDASFLRSSYESTFRYKYLKNKKQSWIELRTFFGKYWDFTNFPTNYASGANNFTYSLSGNAGNQDLFLEDYYFERAYSFNNMQRAENVGGFKSTSSFGTTNTWLASANLYMDLPIKPFGIFADFGTFNSNNENTFVYNVGAAIRLGKVFGVYFPILMSKNLNDSYNNEDYLSKIRLTLKLNIVNKPLSISGLF